MYPLSKAKGLGPRKFLHKPSLPYGAQSAGNADTDRRVLLGGGRPRVRQIGWRMSNPTRKSSPPSLRSAPIGSSSPQVRPNQLSCFKLTTNYERGSFLEKAGYTNLPGSTAANWGVGRACGDLLAAAVKK